MKNKTLFLLTCILFSYNTYAVDTNILSEKIKNKFPMAQNIKKIENGTNSYSFQINGFEVITNENFDYLIWDNDVLVKNKDGNFISSKSNNTNTTYNTNIKPVNQENIIYVANKLYDIVKPIDKKSVSDNLKLFLEETDKNKMFSGNTDGKVVSSIIKNLDTQLAIKEVFGNGENQLVIFTDPDCVFCQNLEKTLKLYGDQLNATIYKFPYFISSHKNAANKYQFIYSQKDKEKAYTDWMLYSLENPNTPEQIKWNDWINKSKRVTNNNSDEDYIKLFSNSREFIEKYKLKSTPTIIFENGTISSNGLISAPELDLLFQYAKARPIVPLPDFQ